VHPPVASGQLLCLSYSDIQGGYVWLESVNCSTLQELCRSLAGDGKFNCNPAVLTYAAAAIMPNAGTPLLRAAAGGCCRSLVASTLV
jgi:hypothetical protein